MPKVSRGVLRLLGVLALAALLLPVSSELIARAAGRDYPRCIQACNEIRQFCNERCSSDCFALFPNDKPLRDACISDCKALCVSESQDCKLVCQAIKNESPQEP